MVCQSLEALVLSW